MKTSLFAVALSMMIAATAVAARAQQTHPPKRIIVIENYFFDEIPIPNDNITTLYMLSTPSGVKATGIEMSEPLPSEALQFALPAEEVAEAEELLRRFAQAKADGKGMSIQFPKSAKLVDKGEIFPYFSATDIDGREWTSADIKGRVAVFNLWFTGCGPCRAEMPELSQWRNQMPEVMFFCSTYEDAATARPVVESCGFNWIALVGDTQFKEWIGDHGYPLTIVVDKEGTIARAEYGTSPLQRLRLRQTIESLR